MFVMRFFPSVVDEGRKLTESFEFDL